LTLPLREANCSSPSEKHLTSHQVSDDSGPSTGASLPRGVRDYSTQEEFLDYHEDLLLDPAAFNRKLISWLLWYNGERPHWSLKLKITGSVPDGAKTQRAQKIVDEYTPLCFLDERAHYGRWRDRQFRISMRLSGKFSGDNTTRKLIA